MGIFDSLFGGMEGRTKLTAQEAFAGVLFGASACDGHIADEEMQSLVWTCGSDREGVPVQPTPPNSILFPPPNTTTYQLHRER